MMAVEWVALCLVPHLGGQTLRQLLADYEGDLSAILAASPEELRQVRGIGAKLAQAITRIDLDATHDAIRRWHDAGYRWMDWDDDRYPPRLKALEDAPPLIFIDSQAPDEGRTLLENRPAVAIVGTRQTTAQIRNLVQDMAAILASYEVTIISGLALGIDTAAHMGALAFPQGQTVAVLGGGIGAIYPPQNASLARAIRTRCALISENSPEAAATAPRLVARNRLITGLAQAVIVVQSSASGGAMHAARFATKQGKTLATFDLPDSGNQALIQQDTLVLDPQILGTPLSFLQALGL